MFEIEGRQVGGDAPVYIIAEIGINHNGKFELAKQLIDAAKAAGCDAVKCQAYKVTHLYSKKAGKLDWEDGGKKYSYDIYEANKSFELPFEWLPKLKKYCADQGLTFFSSVWDIPSADVLDKQGDPVFKIGSSAVTNLPLLEHVAKKQKPVLMSVGGCYLGEIEEALAAMTPYTKDILIFHCHLKYPPPLNYVNASVISTLKHAFPEHVIGYSDHTEHAWEAPVAAVALGAKCIEKHITLDKHMEGPDHFFALEPDELKLMVEKIRAAEKRMAQGEKLEVKPELLGSPKVEPYDNEEYLRDFAFTTIITIDGIKQGEKLTEDNIRVLRPGKLPRGLHPRHFKMLVQKGYKVARDVPMGTPLNWDDLIEH